MALEFDMVRARDGVWIWRADPRIAFCQVCGERAWRPSPIDPTRDVCVACWAMRGGELEKLRRGRFVRGKRGRLRKARAGEAPLEWRELFREFLSSLPSRPGLA